MVLYCDNGRSRDHSQCSTTIVKDLPQSPTFMMREDQSEHCVEDIYLRSNYVSKESKSSLDQCLFEERKELDRVAEVRRELEQSHSIEAGKMKEEIEDLK